MSQIPFGMSIEFLFVTLKSTVFKVFQKLLNTNKLFLLYFGVFLALLLKSDFFKEL